MVGGETSRSSHTCIPWNSVGDKQIWRTLQHLTREGPQILKMPQQQPHETWAHRGIPSVSCGGGLVLVTSKAGGLRGCSLLNSANTETDKHTSYVSWTQQTLKQPNTVYISWTTQTLKQSNTLLVSPKLCKNWNSQRQFSQTDNVWTDIHKSVAKKLPQKVLSFIHFPFSKMTPTTL